jgi:hypothetical protein
VVLPVICKPDFTKTEMAHCGLEGDYSCERPKVRYADGGRLFKLSFGRSPAAEWNGEQFVNYDRVRRGMCKGFSFASRRRMLDHLNTVSCAAEHPDFVTLTLPDDCFQDDVSAFAKTAKLHLMVLRKRLSRACPSACGFWRIEWKSRKSGLYEGKLFPHFHLLLWGFPQREIGVAGNKILESFVPVRDCQQSFAGLCGDVLRSHVFKSHRAGVHFAVRSCAHDFRVEDSDYIAKKFGPEFTFMSFFDWVSVAWYHVVGSGNVDHFLAGCRVEKIRSWGGVLSYCAKYMSKADSENFLEDVPLGRSWGIHNSKNMPWAKMVEMDLTSDAGVMLRRIARHYLEHRLGRHLKRPYGITLYCDTSQWARLLAPAPDTPF